MKRADELAHEQLAAMVNGIQSILWRDGDQWHAVKTWDAETNLERQLEHLGRFGPLLRLFARFPGQSSSCWATRTV
jgi:hypothetical protein